MKISKGKFMKKRMKRFITKQNKGAAIVLVIVAMALVGIFAATIMWMALINYRMKATDRKVKESFYSAETVFEQIVVGLQNASAQSTDEAYAFIMQNYANFDEAKRNSEFQKEYLKNIQQAVAKSETETGIYDIQKLMSYVDAGLDVGIITPSSSGSWVGARSSDASLKGTDGEYKSRYGTIIAPINENYILLEGLHLEYVNAEGFLSVITTDLMITAPTASFTQSGSLSEAFEFAIVADDSLANTTDSGLVTIDGSVYAGDGSMSEVIGENYSKEDSLLVNHKMQILNADYVISKGSVILNNANSELTVGKGSALGDVPEFWTQNIVAEGGTLLLNANTYVEDDLTVNGNNVKITLTESYCGYGNSEVAAVNSSSMIINGIGTTIDMSSLDNLLIAGRAFTSMEGYDATGVTAVEKVTIPMSESIAIKGDQIAYLVPDECVGVLNGKSLFGKNPLTGAEYSKLMDYQTNPEYAASFMEIDAGKALDRYNGQSLASYGINGISDVEKVFIPSNGDTLVYYYLKFNSAENAERFFADYYSQNKEKIDNYFHVYAKGGIKSNNAFTRVNIAGNYLTTVEPTELINQDVALNVLTQSVLSDETLESELKAYEQTSMGLTTKLTKNYLGLTEEEKTHTVLENIFDIPDLKGYLGTSTKSFVLEDGSGYKAIMTNTDAVPGDGNNAYVYDGSDSKIVLIVATGDVEVKAPFEGIIFAGGRVTIASGGKVTSAKNAGKMSEVVRVLQQPHSAVSGDKCPLDFLKGADGYVLAGTALKKDEVTVNERAVDFTELIKYQNWVKQ